ncbi:MAG: A/G-specific adenine glycosylase [Bryobacterales bacterium]|nr:A/G-specific adenine glycosylase [Bryobacterales bacterium]
MLDRLLDWYARHARDLPWRRTRDPYRIWVSEIMLQQTRVEAVIPFYERFLERFPSPEALAAAPEPQVLDAWAGLGYYRRARMLQTAAQRIAAEHGGDFPRDYDAIRALPGIGEYTAGAVASIAFELPHAAVDGNVLRVLSRVFDEEGDIATPRVKARLGERAQRWMDTAPEGKRGALTQALMELGATVCTPKSPKCLLCPLHTECRAFKLGLQAERPVKRAKPKLERVELAVVLVERDSRLLMRQRPADSGVMPGFWEAPYVEGHGLGPDCFATLGIEVEEKIGQFRHGIMFRSYSGVVYRGRLAGTKPESYRWLSAAERAEAPVSTITKKALAAAGWEWF